MTLWKRKSPEDRVAELIARAESALEQREFERALKLGNKIIGLQHTYGFELKACALAALEREPEALQALEESVRVAPDVAKLWSLLGEYRSNARDYAGAQAAFTRAGELDPLMLPECLLNVAIVLLRDGQPARAWSTLEQIATPEDACFRAALSASRADALLELRRYEELLALATSELAAITARLGADPAESDELDAFSRQLSVSKAQALWRGRTDADAALELCRSAVRHVGTRGAAFDLMREIGGLDASRAKSFHLLCHGKAVVQFSDESEKQESDPNLEHGYFTTFRVLADTPEEAFEFVRQFELREWGENFRSLELEKASAAPERVEGCKGIYFRSGRTFYSGRDKKP